MRTLLFSASLLLVIACGTKTPKPDEPGPGSDTVVTPGSDTDQGSAMAGSGSDTAGSSTDMGSGDGSGDGSGAGSGSADVAETPAEDAFKKLSKDEKLKIMKTQVLPAMSKAFKAFDKKEFGKFTCKSCHGKGVADGTYAMPNPDLHQLDFAKLEAGKDHPKTAEFMAKTVVPEMAKLIGVEQVSPDNPNGFGCLHCHTVKK